MLYWVLPSRWTVRAETMSKILSNYAYLQELWPLLRKECKDASALSRIIGVQARMQQYTFLFGERS